MAGFVLALFHKVEMKYRGPVELVKDIYKRLTSRKEGQGEEEGGSAEADPSVSGGQWWAMVGCGVSCDECGVLLSGAGLPSGSGCGEPTAS